MSQKIIVAAAQLAPIFMNKAKTVAKACEAISEAGEKGANLVVFSEAFISGYPDWIWLLPNSKGAELNKLQVELVNNSISVPDSSTAQLCKAAKEARITVAIGINERNSERSNSSIYNSILFISDKGEILGVHRKLIPTGGERLIWTQGDGNSLKTYDTPAGKIAGLICWENFMPLARTTLYEKGVQILVTPTWDKSPDWVQTTQSHAREGGMFIISVCMPLKIDDIPDDFEFKRHYPEGREWVNTGNSCIVSPKGKILAGPLEAQEGILYAKLNLDEITEAKRLFDVAGHYSRPDVFNFSVSQK